MNLLEFQAKKILSEHKIPVPEGKLVETISDLETIGFLYLDQRTAGFAAFFR